MSISVGIIGFGRIGAEHARWIGATEDIRAVFDPTPQRRELARSRGLATVDSLDQLLDDRSIDAVLVSTPTAMHFEHAQRAIAANKHVMVEKPVALDAAQARELIIAASRHARILSVFHNRRWDIDYLTVKDAIGAEVFGNVINVESRIAQFASCVGPAAREWRPNWRNEAMFGGGGLYDWGSHLVDQMWRLMFPARPVRVFAQLRGNVWSSDCDDFARVCIDFDNGAAGLVEINTTTTRPLPRWHIDGTRGSADGPTSSTYDTSEWAQLDFAPAEGGAARRLPTATTGLSEPEIWHRFARAVQGQGHPAVSAESVLPTMILLDAARQSAASGTAVIVRTDDWSL